MADEHLRIRETAPRPACSTSASSSAALIGIYGVILVITGLFTGDNQIDKATG